MNPYKPPNVTNWYRDGDSSNSTKWVIPKYEILSTVFGITFFVIVTALAIYRESLSRSGEPNAHIWFTNLRVAILLGIAGATAACFLLIQFLSSLERLFNKK